MRSRLLALISACLFVAACAYTDVSDFTDPAYRASGQSFDSVAVFAFGFDIGEQQDVENQMAELFSEQGVGAITGTQLAPPTRRMSDVEIVDAITRSGVETVLMISQEASEITESRAPMSYIPGQTSGTVTTFGNTATFNSYQTPGYFVGGGTIDRPNRWYRAALLDARNGAVIWQSDASSRGSGTASFSTLNRSVVNQLFDALQDAELFEQPTG